MPEFGMSFKERTEFYLKLVQNNARRKIYLPYAVKAETIKRIRPKITAGTRKRFSLDAVCGSYF